MKQIGFVISAAILFVAVLSGCDTLSKLPTNTTGGLFSLNGNWQLQSSTDANALVGSVVTVFPVLGNGSVKSLENNTYCLRVSDIAWKEIKSVQTGGFSANNLVSECNSSVVYKTALITIVDNDNVKLTGKTVNDKDLVQLWKRVQN